ncbi:hypothetical protein C7M18_03515 [Bacillus velezensis]|nr:hypothetical protein C7M18_03515 [Bacillus velezensis]
MDLLNLHYIYNYRSCWVHKFSNYVYNLEGYNEKG